MFRGAKAVAIVCEQVNGNRPEAGERETITHPAVSRAEIQNPGAAPDAGREDTRHQVVERAGAHSPLVAVSAR